MIEGPLSATPWNGSRYDPRAKAPHVESWIQRLRHPGRPLALVVRHSIFSPKGRPDDAFGEVAAHWFDGEQGRAIVLRETVPLARCRFSRRDLEARVGLCLLDTFHLEGRLRSASHTLRWQLDYSGDEPPLFLLPRRPSAAAGAGASPVLLTGTPDALFRGALAVDGERWQVDGWPGSQSHRWSTRRSAAHAWAEVTGFDGAPHAILACAAIRARSAAGFAGPARMAIVLRLDDEEYRLGGALASLRARSRLEGFDWRLEAPVGSGGRVRVRVHAPASAFVRAVHDDPAGGRQVVTSTELAASELTLERRGQPTRTLVTANRVAFEIGSARAEPALPSAAERAGQSGIGELQDSPGPATT